jgi:peptide/nickel transport system permease protein
MTKTYGTPKKRVSYGLVAFLLLGVEILVVIFAHQIAPYSPTRQFFGALLQPPSPTHWFGTDSLGQDVLSQVIFGGRTSLLLGFVVMIAGGLGGTILGMLCSTPRRDFWIMRFVDALISFPPILIALAIIGAIGRGLGH